MRDETPLLGIHGLEKHFSQDIGFFRSFFESDDPVKAVNGVSFTVGDGTAVGIIGESGCGKTTLLKAIAGLHEPTSGVITYEGEDITEFSKREMKQYRENVSVIFQNPFTSFDPKFTIGKSLAEPLEIHDIGDKDEKIRQSLEQADLTPPEEYLDRYPDQLSGGELQRAAIARALVVDPDILLADEPVSMLDVSIQASILKLLSELVEDLDLTLLYISHDLSTVTYLCDMIHVMYLGEVVETADTSSLIEDPLHPYTQALIDAIPIPDPTYDRERTVIAGNPEMDSTSMTGCIFKDRCPERMDICDVEPEHVEAENGRFTSCHLYYEHDQESGEAPEIQ